MTERCELGIQLPQVAVASMNATHAEELGLVERLLAALDVDDADAARAAAQAFAAHVEEHFAREERLMEQHGFPPLPLHKGEHDHMRRLVREACADVGGTAARRALRRFVLERFLPWLQHHVATMDAATANFLAMHGVE